MRLLRDPGETTGGTTLPGTGGSTLASAGPQGHDDRHGRVAGAGAPRIRRPLAGDRSARGLERRPHADRVARHDRGRRARERRVWDRRRRVRDDRSADRASNRQPDRLAPRVHRSRAGHPGHDRGLRGRRSRHLPGQPAGAGRRWSGRDRRLRSDGGRDGVPPVLLPHRVPPIEQVATNRRDRGRRHRPDGYRSPPEPGTAQPARAGRRLPRSEPARHPLDGWLHLDRAGGDGVGGRDLHRGGVRRPCGPISRGRSRAPATDQVGRVHRDACAPHAGRRHGRLGRLRLRQLPRRHGGVHDHGS